MAINKIDWPAASAPDVTVDYPRQNNNLQAAVRGYNAVTLTNWDETSTPPKVAEGSVIECNGVLYEADADYTIAAPTAGYAYYLIFNDSTETFSWTATVPTWEGDLNGWYVGTYRFTGHVSYFFSAGTCREKREYGRGQSGAKNITPVGTASFGIIGLTCTVADGTVEEELRAGNAILGEVTISSSGTAGDTINYEYKLRILTRSGTWITLKENSANLIIGTTPSATIDFFAPGLMSTGENYQLQLGVTNVSGSGSTANSVIISQDHYGYYATW